MGCGFTFIYDGFCYSPRFGNFFYRNFDLLNCVVFDTIDSFTVFSTFDLDKLGKISLTPLERLP